MFKNLFHLLDLHLIHLTIKYWRNVFLNLSKILVKIFTIGNMFLFRSLMSLNCIDRKKSVVVHWRHRKTRVVFGCKTSNGSLWVCGNSWTCNWTRFSKQSYLWWTLVWASPNETVPRSVFQTNSHSTVHWALEWVIYHFIFILCSNCV